MSNAEKKAERTEGPFNDDELQILRFEGKMARSVRWGSFTRHACCFLATIDALVADKERLEKKLEDSCECIEGLIELWETGDSPDPDQDIIDRSNNMIKIIRTVGEGA